MFFGGALAHILLPSESDILFSIGLFICGFTYGGQWSIFPVLIGEIFGLKFITLNYSCLNLAQIIGSFVLSSYLPAVIYDYHAINGTCHGIHCFCYSHYFNSFILIAAVLTCDGV